MAITNREVVLSVILAAFVLGVIILFLKEIFMTTYNEEIAQVSGVSVRSINILFLIILAVSIVISIKIVGIILISALLVIPGATAQLFAKNLYTMIIISCGAAVLSTILGLFISYEFDIASGGSIVLTATAIFLISLLLKKRN